MLLVLISLLLCSNLIPPDKRQSEDWIVPESAVLLENPTDKEDKDDLTYGQTLFSQHCKSCHGKNGLGDGPSGRNLEKTPTDFTSESFLSQTDGAIFYKISTGRDEMPEFEKKIRTDEDRWLIVNYLRELGKN